LIAEVIFVYKNINLKFYNRGSQMNRNLNEKLNKYLADTAVMYIKLHNLHWNIYGSQFKGVHEYLEALYDAFTENMDAIAELIRMYDIYPPASMADYLELSGIEELPSEGIDIKQALSIVLEDLKAIEAQAKTIRLLANEEDAFDVVAMMEEHCAEYKKAIWFIKSMLTK
jgi:starvation-inducible DNA-binding protein